MGRRLELIPLAVALLLTVYLTAGLPSDSLPPVLLYCLLALAALKERALPYGAAAVASGLLFEWLSGGGYLAIAGIGAAVSSVPFRMEKQPVKMWERLLNAAVAGTLTYASLMLAKTGFKIAGVIAALSTLSGNRGISSGGILAGSAVLLAIPAANLNGMNPDVFFTASALLMLYSLHHLRKLLR